jgi:hypothetical protein
MEQGSELPVGVYQEEEMEEQMTKSKLYKAIYAEREALETTLARLGVDEMIKPALESGWSVKDVLAHIVDWEQRMIEWINESLDGDGPDLSSDWSDEVLNKLNQEIYEANKDRDLQDVLDEFTLSYQQSWTAVKRLNDEDLFEPNRFAWREGRPMWYIVDANMSAHYKEHNEAIKKWLEEKR